MSNSNSRGVIVGLNPAPASADWDHDGDLDFFIGSQTGRMTVFENRGSPVVMNLVDVSSNFTGAISIWPNIPAPAPALGDWSGDGYADLAVAGDTQVVWIISSTSNFLSPQFPAVQYGLPINTTSVAAAFGEVTGEGKIDLLVLLNNGSIRAYRNRGSTIVPFLPGPTITNLLGTSVPDATGLSCDDLDRDGLLDVLVSDVQGRIWEFRGETNGGFTLRSKVFAGTYDGFANRLTISAGDLDGDGDTDILGGFAEGGLIYLRNPEAHLVVRPPVATVLSGSNVVFTVTGNTGPVNWSLRENQSLANIATNGLYTAGTNTPGKDLVEAFDAVSGLRGQAYVNVIGQADVTKAGKAVIIAGGKRLDDPVWRATDYVADYAYDVLRFVGFDRNNIEYLSFGPNNDVDENGLLDDIDGWSSSTNTSLIFTNELGNTDRLFIYLANHGSADQASNGFMRLNSGELLSASQVDDWLDSLQDTWGMDVVVVLDFCYSGSWLDELTYAGPAERIVIAASGENELTYFLAGGLISYSQIFFTGLLQGFDVLTSHNLALNAMSAYQGSLLDDNRDGENTPDDGPLAQVTYIGASTTIGRDIPSIGTIAPNVILNEGTESVLWAYEISGVHPIQRVWATIIAPNHAPDADSEQPVIDVPVVDLVWNPSTRRYEATSRGFSEPGTYAVTYFAEDIWGGVSFPRQGFVTQAGYDERVILVAGGPTNNPEWASIHTMATLAYQTFKTRQLDGSQIQYLGPQGAEDVDGDGTNDVDGAVSMGAINSAINTWAAGSDKLTVYIISREESWQAKLGPTVFLNVSQLDAALDAYQSTNRLVTVVMEYNSSGKHLDNLLPPPGRERIVIASTKAGFESHWLNGGLTSFSGVFLSSIMNGATIGNAFKEAKRVMWAASHRLQRQQALMDDNGDGFSTKDDGDMAGISYLGPAFVTGDDVPSIGSVGPEYSYSGITNLMIWAEGITDVDGITSVWAVITEPGFAGTNPPQTGLVFNAQSGRWEAVYPSKTVAGSYTFTFYAKDGRGQVSEPKKMDLTGADEYEVDDTKDAARDIEVGLQQGHNIHESLNPDWVKFYATTGITYTIEAEHMGTNLDVVLDVYYEQFDGTLIPIETNIDLFGKGLFETEGTLLNLSTETNLEAGIYYVRVRPYASTDHGVGSEYNLRVFVPVGAGTLMVTVADKLDGTKAPPGAKVILDNVQTQGFGGGLTVTFQNVTPGVHTLRVPKVTGYLEEEAPDLQGQVQNPDSALYGNPKEMTVLDETWQNVVFQLVPYGRVSGTIRDRVTGAYLEGAKVSFRATSGRIAGYVYDGYPNFATYESNWWSSSDGTFPTNVLLPTVNWNVELVRTNYQGLVVTNILLSFFPGAQTNIGHLYMNPIDVDSNRLADAWEILFFGSNGMSATVDQDGDGYSNEQEYRMGTGPNDGSSKQYLKVIKTNQAGGVVLEWSAAPGRVYIPEYNRFQLVTGVWSAATGARTAGVNEATMQWMDPSQTNNSGNAYRVKVKTP